MFLGGSKLCQLLLWFGKYKGLLHAMLYATVYYRENVLTYLQ